MAQLTCPSCDYTTDSPDEMVEHRVQSHAPRPEGPAQSASLDGKAQPGAPATKKRTPIIVCAVVVLALIATAVVTAFLLMGGEETYTIEGTVDLVDFGGDYEDGEGCAGEGGYDDMRVGASVEVKDGDGKTIAVSELDSSEGYETIGCSFSFTVEDVPKADFYEVQVAHRGGLSFSFDEMVANDWEVGLSLGGD